MRTLTLGLPWFGGIRLSARAVVIGAIGLALGTTQIAHGAINVWTTNGPQSRFIYALAIDPSAPSTLYAAAAGGGIFKSTDGGTTWRATDALIGDTDSTIFGLVIDPVTPTTLYTATLGAGVFKSTDGGQSGNAINSGLRDFDVSALAIDPITPTTLYAGTGNDGLYKSTDAGATWCLTGLNNYASQFGQPIRVPPIASIAVNPITPTTLYVGTRDGGTVRAGVWRNPFGGNNDIAWQMVNDGLPNTEVDALAIDPTSPTTLYAGTLGQGVFKTTNAGASWRAVNSGLGALGVYALAIDPNSPTTVYSGTYYGGVFKTTDGGESWNAMNSGLTDSLVYSLAIDPITPTTLYAGTYAGGVFSIQQVAVCAGDCGGIHAVAMTDLITLVNIALGNAPPSTCLNGLPIGGDVNISVIVQAVNNALNGCA